MHFRWPKWVGMAIRYAIKLPPRRHFSLILSNVKFCKMVLAYTALSVNSREVKYIFMKNMHFRDLKWVGIRYAIKVPPRRHFSLILSNVKYKCA